MSDARWLIYSIGICVLITVVATYYHVYVTGNYVVRYELVCSVEGLCNIPDCEYEDNRCVGEGMRIIVMEKLAHDLHTMCGRSIIGCEAAKSCMQDDKYCHSEVLDDY